MKNIIKLFVCSTFILLIYHYNKHLSIDKILYDKNINIINNYIENSYKYNKKKYSQLDIDEEIERIKIILKN